MLPGEWVDSREEFCGLTVFFVLMSLGGVLQGFGLLSLFLQRLDVVLITFSITCFVHNEPVVDTLIFHKSVKGYLLIALIEVLEFIINGIVDNL